MGSDPLSPIAPARVRVLLLPCGRIKRAKFQSFVQRLQAEHVIRLGDISPDGRPNRNMFSPLAFPAGMIVYDLTTSFPPESHLALSPFELHREPLVIVAITDGSELDLEIHANNNGDQKNGHTSQLQLQQLRDLDQELEVVRDQYQQALVHQLLIFDCPTSLQSTKMPDGLIAIPKPEDSKVTTMRTVVCDLSSLLLAEMTTLAKSLQGRPMIESPNKGDAMRQSSWASGDPAMLSRRSSQYSIPDQASGSGSPTAKSDRSHVRMSMPAKFHSATSDTNRSASGSRPTTPINGSGASDERSHSKSPESAAFSRTKTDSFREHSRDRISIQGFGSGSLSERSRNKGKGRLAIAIGSLYLQAGRWGDAIRELVDGATIAKSNSDHLWHAKALENILVSMLMLAWAGLDFQIPPICYTSAEKAPYHTPSAIALESQKSPTSNRLVSLQNLTALLPEFLDKILNLYERASNFAGESLPQLPFSETILRFSKLLTSIHSEDGKLDDGVLQFLVYGLPIQNAPKPGSTRLNIQPSRAFILGMLFRAFPASSLTNELSVVDRTIILSGIASVLGQLGYQRKKAMVMRELVSVLVPALVQARMVGAAEMGIHPAAGLAALSSVNGNTNGAGALELGEGDVESGVEDLLSLMGRIYGVVSFEPLLKSASKSNSEEKLDDSDEAAVARILDNARARKFGGRSLKMNVLRACINLAEALPDFHGVLRFTADLLRTAGSGVAPGLRSEDASPMMAREEQVRLGMNITRTVDAAKKLGLRNLEAEYWDEFLVRGIELEPLPIARLPVPHRSNELEGAKSSAEPHERNPFIYNPFLKRPDAAAVASLLVAGESAVFRVTLQNPYEFDIEVEAIRLQSEGVEFTSAIQGTTIGPYRTQILNVSGTARSAGSLEIKGCIIKIRGCRERRFPIFSKSWAPQPEIKIKATGLNSTHSTDPFAINIKLDAKKALLDTGSPKPSSLALSVISAQPVIVIKSSTLSQTAAMVLEGERQAFSVTLQNLSATTPADLILFSFQDSTQSPLQVALSNREASAAELYECELILSRKPALRWLKQKDEAVFIKPGGTATFQFEILGKPGLTSGVIQVDYAYLGLPADEIKEKFHTRHVLLPLTVTVNAGVELSRMDIIPLGGEIPRHLWKSGFKETAGDTIQPDDYSLLLLDLRNAWPYQMQVHIEVAEGETIDEQILPGNTSRIAFPIRRIFLENPFAAIPALDPSRQRQFVVSTGRISADSERATREAFWYREEILKTLKGSWKLDSGQERTGDIELRGMRLTPRMIEALKIEDVAVELILSETESDTDSEPNTVVPVCEFFRLKAKITNRTSQAIYPMLRLQPSLRHHAHNQSLDLAKKIVWDGTLQHTLALLPAKQSIEVLVTMTALCRGEFEISASVEEARLLDNPDEAIGSEKKSNGRPRANTGAMMDAILGTRERRIWHTRKPCIVVVGDASGSDDE